VLFFIESVKGGVKKKANRGEKGYDRPKISDV
jgi:hypothetical protein